MDGYYFSSMQQVRFNRGRRQPMPPSSTDLMYEVVSAIYASHNVADVMSEIGARVTKLGSRGVRSDYSRR